MGMIFEILQARSQFRMLTLEPTEVIYDPVYNLQAGSKHGLPKMDEWWFHHNPACGG